MICNSSHVIFQCSLSQRDSIWTQNPIWASLLIQLLNIQLSNLCCLCLRTPSLVPPHFSFYTFINFKPPNLLLQSHISLLSYCTLTSVKLWCSSPILKLSLCFPISIISLFLFPQIILVTLNISIKRL